MESLDSNHNVAGTTGDGDFPDPPAEMIGIMNEPEEATNSENDQLANEQERSQFGKQITFEVTDPDGRTEMADSEQGEGRKSLMAANSDGDLLDEPDQVTAIISDPDDGETLRNEDAGDAIQETGARLPDPEYVPEDANPESSSVVEEETIGEQLPETEQSSALAVAGDDVNSMAAREAVDGQDMEEGLANEQASISNSADPVPVDVITEKPDPTQPDGIDEGETPNDQLQDKRYSLEEETGTELASPTHEEETGTELASPTHDDQVRTSQAENGAIQSMSDQRQAVVKNSKAGLDDPEDPEYWFSARSPTNMDCYFAFACISCVINFLIGSVALYLVQKGRDSSTKAEAKRFGCYSIIAGFIAILVTAAIIALVVVFI